MFVELPPEVDAYVVWVTGAGKSGWYPQWLTGATKYPAVLKGYGYMSFGPVPKAEAGWAVDSGGAASGDCAPSPTDEGPLAWGVSYKWVRRRPRRSWRRSTRILSTKSRRSHSLTPFSAASRRAAEVNVLLVTTTAPWQR